jgi:integrase/recombinase XerC
VTELEMLDPIALRAFLARHRGRARAIVQEITAIRALCRWLLKQGILCKDPTAALVRPRVPPPALPCTLHVDDVASLLSAPSARTAEGRRDRALLELCYGGLGARDLAALDLEDLDLDVRRVGRLAGLGAVQLPDRALPIGSAAVRAIGDYLLRRHLLEPGKSRALFLARGRRLSPDGVRDVVHLHGEQALGRPDVTPSMLRASCAAHLLDRGADLVVVRILLGLGSVRAVTRFEAVAVEHLVRVYQSAHPLARRRPLLRAA